MINTQDTNRHQKTSLSLRRDQTEWIAQEAERQLHGNQSRIVQDAIDHYRRWMALEAATHTTVIKGRPE